MEADNLKRLHIKRGNYKAQLSLLEKYLSKLNLTDVSEVEIVNLEQRLNKIEPISDLFNEVQSEIEILHDNIDDNLTERELFQDMYFDLTSKIKKVLIEHNSNLADEVLSHSSSVASQATQAPHGTPKTCFKLPPINLPTFDGTFTLWREFYDTFNSLIHTNNDLTNVQKLTYLRSSLKSEPAGLVRSLETTENNYEIAWSLLKKRYNNKRRIISNHVQALLDIPSIARESCTSLRQLINFTQNHVQCLKSLDQPVDSWSALLVPIITSKLDIQTIKDWETKINSLADNTDNVPSLTELLDFLNTRQNTLESITQRKSVDQGKIGIGYATNQRTTKSFSSISLSCVLCKQDHLMQNCETFLKLSQEERSKKAKELKVCLNCLRGGHFVQSCSSKSSCKECNKRHHTALHLPYVNKFTKGTVNTNSCTSSNSLPETETELVTQESNVTVNCTSADLQPLVLLSTAKVEVFDIHNNTVEARVLLDSGSQSNFITENLCNKLKLKMEPIEINVIGINQGSAKITRKVNIKIKSRINPYAATLSCLVLPQITHALPMQSIKLKSVEIPPNIQLADPTFYKSQEIDILIGASLFYNLLCIGQISNQNLPTLQKTRFGWIISGTLKNMCINQGVTCLSLSNLHKEIEKFWQVDEFTSNKQKLTSEEEFCEAHFKDNTTRDEKGKFIVKIPFNEKITQLGDSFSIAESRFYSLERRFLKDQNLKEMYCRFMNEYISLNHMTKIKPDDKVSFFLPHHPVIKESSETTKCRVVFDGSCKLNSGLPINETQYAGPTIQDDIFSIIARFRTYPFVLIGDIEKMYRQVWIHPDHRQYQRILWRENIQDELHWYELKTVTYGTTTAPFLAVRCLTQLAIDNQTQYPIESRIIKEDFYVDDMITGTKSIEELNNIRINVDQILKSAGFHLRKWTSNVSDLNLSKETSIPVGERINKTLGVQWNPTTDVFSYSTFNLTPQRQITKRSILGITAQLYDPLGLIAPIIIVAKFIIQELWQSNLGWDESVPIDIQTKWLNFKDKLKHINSIIIPRHVLTRQPSRIELHSFSDASERGYGACIYLRSISDKGEILVRLLAAKSRVAPLKNVSLPRLELCAAAVAAELVDKFRSILRLEIKKQYHWCDSQIVLSWLKSSPNKWKTYVANRVSQIQELTNANNWQHVESKDNAADLISRGVAPHQLHNLRLWWHGPQWLSQDENEWPTSSTETNLQETSELRKQVHSLVTLNNQDSFPIDKYSSFDKLRRITAFCLRFKNNCLLRKEDRETGTALSTGELDNALLKLIKIVQGSCFQSEINNLKQSKPLHPKASILSLTPFLDSQGVLRVGGRLQLSQFSYAKKHPILLPKHHLTNLILIKKHKELLHAGPKLLLSTVREQFWPINGRNTAKKIVRDCVKCFRFRAKPVNQIMGSLPEHRTMIMYPFHSTAVDYAGPFLLKDRLGRGSKTIKGYICLFICLSVKAIHLEIVTSLSTDAFLASLKRFVARRGKPLHVFSDNGTNFVGANNEMSKLGEFLQNNADHVRNVTADVGINWHFIPPNSPHFGGLWEAGVKSTKHHLKRVLSNSPLTYEEFHTITTQIESILNSRPLTALTSDPNDVEVLTPAHFLIGRTFSSIPDPNLNDVPVNRLSRYEHLQQLTRHFWDKWSKEYISELQQRNRWKQTANGIQLGTIVLIKEDNLPPSRWQLGRVIKLHPGADNITRVVSVKCANSELKRSVAKVCALPFVGN